MSEKKGCFRKIKKYCKSLNKRKQVEDLTVQLLATKVLIAHVNGLTELSTELV